MVASSLPVSSQRMGNEFPYYKLRRHIPFSISHLYKLMKKLKEMMEKDEIPFSKCVSVELYDIVNLLNTLEQEMSIEDPFTTLNDFNLELKNRFQLLENYLASKRFLNQINEIRKNNDQPKINQKTIHKKKKRVYAKKMIDIKRKGMQIPANSVKSLLNLTEKQIIIEKRTKRQEEDAFGRPFTIYCDIDHLIIGSLTEIVTVSKFKEIDLKYIVIGSGDKDYVNVLETMNKNVSIIVVTMSGSSLSKDLRKVADMVISLYPKVLCIKPRNY